MEESIDRFAKELIKLSDQGGVTPVLTEQAGVTLRPPFFCCLADSLRVHTGRTIQYDLLIDPAGMGISFQKWSFRRRAKQMTVALNHHATVVLCTTVGRPSSNQHPLVVGIAPEHTELPRWSKPIRLCLQPNAFDDVSLALT